MSDGRNTEAIPAQSIKPMRLDTLYIVAELGPTDGVSVASELDDAYGGERVRPATVYHNLDALVDANYVTKASAEWRENRYELTEEGRGALEADRKWRTEA